MKNLVYTFAMMDGSRRLKLLQIIGIYMTQAMPTMGKRLLKGSQIMMHSAAVGCFHFLFIAFILKRS